MVWENQGWREKGGGGRDGTVCWRGLIFEIFPDAC